MLKRHADVKPEKDTRIPRIPCSGFDPAWWLLFPKPQEACADLG